MTDASDGTKKVDLVLEGGGVKGIALVGAYQVLTEAGYVVNRVAGSSAGAIVGTLIASGMTPAKMVEVMRALDYNKFEDGDFLDHLGKVGQGLSILFEKGIYKGDFFEHWLDDQIDGRTFGTFRQTDDDPASATADPKKAFKLVVMASDISNHRLARLPWEYITEYPQDETDTGGVDERKVSEAVRCSMSIPFFFEPHQLAYLRRHDGSFDKTKAWMVDGGMLSNFPVDAFDRTDNKRPRWPTFGIKLSAQPETDQGPQQIKGTLDFGKALISTMTGFFDRVHIEEPSVIARTMFVDTGNVKATDFDLTPATQDTLFKAGQAAATKFLKTWDFEKYIADFVKPTG